VKAGVRRARRALLWRGCHKAEPDRVAGVRHGPLGLPLSPRRWASKGHSVGVRERRGEMASAVRCNGWVDKTTQHGMRPPSPPFRSGTLWMATHVISHIWAGARYQVYVRDCTIVTPEAKNPSVGGTRHARCPHRPCLRRRQSGEVVKTLSCGILYIQR